MSYDFNITRSVQGTALIFNPKHDWVNGGVILQPHIITRRHLKSETCSSMFIENTNLDSLPLNATGALVAFSKFDSRRRQEKLWSLGVLLFLHPQKTVIIPCTTVNIQYHYSCVDRYSLSEATIELNSAVQHQQFTLIYLNALNNPTTVGDDGFIQSNVEGPDVLFNFNTIPFKSLADKYHDVKVKNDPLFKVCQPSVNVDFRTSVFENKKPSKTRTPIYYNNDRTTKLIVVQKKVKEVPGYAFPYPIGKREKNKHCKNSHFWIIKMRQH